MEDETVRDADIEVIATKDRLGMELRSRDHDWTLTKFYFLFIIGQEIATIDYCQKELSMGHCAFVDFSNYMREICTLYVEKEWVNKIGGNGFNVEIDKSLLSKRKK